MPAPDTIVLIHGFWVTPRSWEDWVAHYEAKGFKVIAPAYPGLEVEVEALNADPTPIAELTVPKIVDHLESVVSALENPPIIIGHSAGGVFTQLLLDKGYGASAVALNSAPTEGVKVAPLVAAALDLPGPQEPGEPPPRGRVHVRAVQLRVHQRRRRGDRAAALRALRDPGQRRDPVRAASLANVKPGHQDTWVDYHNDNRAPLLFVSGSTDHIMPPSVQQSNAKHYKSEQDDHRDHRVRGPALHAGAGGLGEDRRPRARVGAGQRAPRRVEA